MSVTMTAVLASTERGTVKKRKFVLVQKDFKVKRKCTRFKITKRMEVIDISIRLTFS